MIKRILPILIGAAILLAACAPQAAPTMLAADVEGTAMSSALTMVAATQMAIPTATLPPPTEVPSPTPLPTFTALALDLPTLQPLPTATTVAAAGNCLKPLDIGAAGPTNKMRIENVSGGTIEYIGLNLATNAFGQCGAVSYNNIKNNEKIIVNLPKGNWYAFAGITFKDGSSSSSEGPFVIRIGDEDLLRIMVGKDTISARP